MDTDIDLPLIPVETPLGRIEILLIDGDREGDLVPLITPLEVEILGRACRMNLDTAPGIRKNARHGAGYGLAPTIRFATTREKRKDASGGPANIHPMGDNRLGSGLSLVPASHLMPHGIDRHVGEVEVEWGRVKSVSGGLEDGTLGENAVERRMRELVETLFADASFETRLQEAIAASEKAWLRWKSARLRRSAEELQREAEALDAEAEDIPVGPRM